MNKTITMYQLKRVLPYRDSRTIYEIIANGELPKPEMIKNKYRFDYDKVCKALKVENLDENFVDNTEAIKILGTSRPLSVSYCKWAGIPFRCFLHRKRAKLIFLRSELEAFKNK